MSLDPLTPRRVARVRPGGAPPHRRAEGRRSEEKTLCKEPPFGCGSRTGVVMRPAHHASPRARRQRRPPAKYEAVPASATLPGDFAVAPAPATTKSRERRPPAKYEAVPASATLPGDFAVAPAPATTKSRERRPPAKYEAVPASATLSGDFAVAPAPATTETRGNETVKLSTNPALWVKGAVVAVHCPEDEPCPFWLSRIDADADGADETMITWLEPTGKGGKSYAIGGEDPIATTSIICTVREAGRWKSGRAFTLTPAEREAVLELIEAEHCVDVEDTDEEAEEAQQARLPPSVPMVHLDGLPGSGKTYICSQLAKTHGYSVIELDEITQRPGENFGFKQRIRSLDQLRRAFHREITARVAKTQRDADSPVLLSGVSRVLAEQWGELCIIPPELQTAKIWIDIAPPSGVSYTGKLLKSVMRLRKMGVADSHIAEVVESARRAVLRDLRDTAPTAWAATAEDWGDDSSFYTHMADNHPDAQQALLILKHCALRWILRRPTNLSKCLSSRSGLL